MGGCINGVCFGFGNVDCGMLNQPPASPSCRLYEPEAVGAIGAYAPEGAQRAWRIVHPLSGYVHLSASLVGPSYVLVFY